MKIASLLAAVALPLAAAQCDQEYECEYRSPDFYGTFYDLRPLCTLGMPYVFENTTTGVTFHWMVCGSATSECIPPYPVEYQRGVAMQFFGPPPAANATCTSKTGDTVACTRDCEVLAVGVPTITLIDPKESFGGVNITHRGVPSAPGDRYQCPDDPTTGATQEREVTIQVKCNAKYIMKPHVVSASEVSPCKYVIVMESHHGCGCIPFCYGRNCGSDGCGGFCGPQGRAGACPEDGSQCTDQGICCVPDCRGRMCGSDGCGGQCGTCPGGQECTKYQTCYDPAVAPSPAPSNLPSVTVYTTTGGDKFASFLGGILTTGIVAMGVTYFFRYRAGR